MSIEKYLNNIRVPEKHPGPFSVRIKHDVKKRLVARRKRKDQFFLVMGSFCLILFLFSGYLLYNPHYAASLHNNVLVKTGFLGNNNEDSAQIDAERLQAEMPLTETGRYLGSQSFSPTTSSRLRPVSTIPSESASSYQIMELSQLEEGTPYIIRKVKNGTNSYIYFINEIATEDSSRIPY